jgi:hypothetical protein
MPEWDLNEVRAGESGFVADGRSNTEAVSSSRPVYAIHTPYNCDEGNIDDEIVDDLQTISRQCNGTIRYYTDFGHGFYAERRSELRMMALYEQEVGKFTRYLRDEGYDVEVRDDQSAFYFASVPTVGELVIK